jgi:phosphohistidine phosphatase SixA
VQTAQAAAAVLKTEPKTFTALDNTLPPEEALAHLRGRAYGAVEVLAVGHQPQIGEIAAALTGEIFEIRPAGVIAVEMEPQPHLLWPLNADELG